MGEKQQQLGRERVKTDNIKGCENIWMCKKLGWKKEGQEKNDMQ